MARFVMQRLAMMSKRRREMPPITLSSGATDSSTMTSLMP